MDKDLYLFTICDIKDLLMIFCTVYNLSLYWFSHGLYVFVFQRLSLGFLCFCFM